MDGGTTSRERAPKQQDSNKQTDKITEYGAQDAKGVADTYKMYARYQKELQEAKKLNAAKIQLNEDEKSEERKATEYIAAEQKKLFTERQKDMVELAKSTAALFTASTKADASGKRTGVKADAQTGVISKREEQRQLAAIDAQELKDYKKTLADELALLKGNLENKKAALEAAKGTGDEEEATKELTQAQLQYNEAVAAGVTEMQALKNNITMAEATLKSNPMTEWIAQSKDVGNAMQQNITRGLDGISAGFAKSAVEGKGFGKAMQSVAREVAEGFIAMETKRLLAAVMTELHLTAVTVAGNAARTADDRMTGAASVLTSAKTAAAKGFDAGMKFPFPVDLVMAPVLLLTT